MARKTEARGEWRLEAVGGAHLGGRFLVPLDSLGESPGSDVLGFPLFLRVFFYSRSQRRLSLVITFCEHRCPFWLFW